jgi:hypothetical protein
MKQIIAFIALVLITYSVPAFADTCTASVSVTTASTKVLDGNDVMGGRHYLLVQNIGAQNVFCTIGETATTSKGFLLETTGHGSLLFQAFLGSNGVSYTVPTQQVNCIAAASTSIVSVCDY